MPYIHFLGRSMGVVPIPHKKLETNMPYISEDDRNHIDNYFEKVDTQGLDYLTIFGDIAQCIQTVPSGKIGGAFNYFVCRLFMETFDPSGYTDIAEGLSHLNEAQHEIRRRILAPYEDKAAKKNGDVPEFAQFVRDHI